MPSGLFGRPEPMELALNPTKVTITSSKGLKFKLVISVRELELATLL